MPRVGRRGRESPVPRQRLRTPALLRTHAGHRLRRVGRGECSPAYHRRAPGTRPRFRRPRQHVPRGPRHDLVEQVDRAAPLLRQPRRKRQRDRRLPPRPSKERPRQLRTALVSPDSCDPRHDCSAAVYARRCNCVPVSSSFQSELADPAEIRQRPMVPKCCRQRSSNRSSTSRQSAAS
jgi:hypothetical protein